MQVYPVAAVFSLLVTCQLTVSAHTQHVEFSVLEEQPALTVVGYIVQAANLSRLFDTTTLASLTYKWAPRTHHRDLFDLDEKSGIVRTLRPVDREAVCPHREPAACSIHLTAAIYPVLHYQLIRIVVHVIDINDHAPVFPRELAYINVSETSPPGSGFPLPAAVDKDAEPLSIRSYYIRQDQRGGGAGGVFDIDHSRRGDLRLTLTRAVDRETQSSYLVHVVAEDGGNPPRSAVLAVHVTVIDVNDNAPVFVNDSYVVTVRENVAVGTTLTRVTATDADEGRNGRVQYEFARDVSDVIRETFRVSSTSGAIVTNRLLDKETTGLYSIVVTAKDQGDSALSSNVEVLVIVDDVNDNAPQLTVTPVTACNCLEIEENAQVGFFIAHLSVFDADEQQIRAGSNSNAFACSLNSDKDFLLVPITPSDYKLVSARTFDYESDFSLYNLTVTCQDSGEPPQSVAHSFEVFIKDQNDNVPIFDRTTYFRAVPEDMTYGEEILRLAVTDLDSGSNGRVHFDIVGEASETLSLHPSQGILTATGSFDYELRRSHVIIVIAFDNGTPSFTSTATVSLNVIDVNDEPPKFRHRQMTFEIEENLPAGSEVGYIEAFDLDSAPFNKITYHLADASRDFSVFAVNRQTGLITTKIALDREVKSVYELIATAENPGYQLKTTMRVTVTVTDVNDNRPHLMLPTNAVVVGSESNVGQFVAQIEAFDPDIGINAALRYNITGGNNLSLFAMDSLQGTVRVNRKLTDVSVQSVSLLISVWDQGEPQLFSEGNFTIRINRTDRPGEDAMFRDMWILSALGRNILIVLVAAVVVSLLCALLIITIVRLQLSSKAQYNCRKAAASKSQQQQQQMHLSPSRSLHIDESDRAYYDDVTLAINGTFSSNGDANNKQLSSLYPLPVLSLASNSNGTYGTYHQQQPRLTTTTADGTLLVRDKEAAGAIYSDYGEMDSGSMNGGGLYGGWSLADWRGRKLGEDLPIASHRHVRPSDCSSLERHLTAASASSPHQGGCSSSSAATTAADCAIFHGGHVLARPPNYEPWQQQLLHHHHHDLQTVPNSAAPTGNVSYQCTCATTTQQQQQRSRPDSLIWSHHRQDSLLAASAAAALSCPSCTGPGYDDLQMLPAELHALGPGITYRQPLPSTAALAGRELERISIADSGHGCSED